MTTRVTRDVQDRFLIAPGLMPIKALVLFGNKDLKARGYPHPPRGFTYLICSYSPAREISTVFTAALNLRTSAYLGFASSAVCSVLEFVGFTGQAGRSTPHNNFGNHAWDSCASSAKPMCEPTHTRFFPGPES